MSVIRVEKSKDFTTISNIPLKDKNLSLKAKGLLAIVLTLPESWDYSINGICTIVKESRDAVMSAFSELEKYGYMKRSRVRNSNGTLGGTEYIFLKSQFKIKRN